MLLPSQRLHRRLLQMLLPSQRLHRQLRQMLLPSQRLHRQLRQMLLPNQRLQRPILQWVSHRLRVGTVVQRYFRFRLGGRSWRLHRLPGPRESALRDRYPTVWRAQSCVLRYRPEGLAPQSSRPPERHLRGLRPCSRQVPRYGVVPRGCLRVVRRLRSW